MEIEKKIKDTTDEVIRGQLENTIYRLKQKLEEMQKEDRIYDYLLDTGDILFEYYDLQNKISQGHTTSTTQWVKRKPGDVLSALETAASIDNSLETIHEKKKKSKDPVNRDILLEKYLLRINPEYVKKTNELDDMSGECVEW